VDVLVDVELDVIVTVWEIVYVGVIVAEMMTCV
jgi:hypothetical protein